MPRQKQTKANQLKAIANQQAKLNNAADVIRQQNSYHEQRQKVNRLLEDINKQLTEQKSTKETYEVENAKLSELKPDQEEYQKQFDTCNAIKESLESQSKELQSQKTTYRKEIEKLTPLKSAFDLQINQYHEAWSVYLDIFFKNDQFQEGLDKKSKHIGSELLATIDQKQSICTKELRKLENPTTEISSFILDIARRLYELDHNGRSGFSHYILDDITRARAAFEDNKMDDLANILRDYYYSACLAINHYESTDVETVLKNRTDDNTLTVFRCPVDYEALCRERKQIENLLYMALYINSSFMNIQDLLLIKQWINHIELQYTTQKNIQTQKMNNQSYVLYTICCMHGLDANPLIELCNAIKRTLIPMLDLFVDICFNDQIEDQQSRLLLQEKCISLLTSKPGLTAAFQMQQFMILCNKSNLFYKNESKLTDTLDSSNHYSVKLDDRKERNNIELKKAEQAFNDLKKVYDNFSQKLESKVAMLAAKPQKVEILVCPTSLPIEKPLLIPIHKKI